MPDATAIDDYIKSYGILGMIMLIILIRMANVLAGAYPDVFKAASIYSGVPDGCFAVAGATATQDPPGWSNSCANGQLTKTGAQWGDMVRSYYPGYTGTRTRIQT